MEKKVPTLAGAPHTYAAQSQAHSFFQDSSNFPFCESAQHLPENAWWMAELSLLAYCDRVTVVHEIGKLPQWADAKVTWFDDVVHGFLLENERFAILVFRGPQEVVPDDAAGEADAVSELDQDGLAIEAAFSPHDGPTVLIPGPRGS